MAFEINLKPYCHRACPTANEIGGCPRLSRHTQPTLTPARFRLTDAATIVVLSIVEHQGSSCCNNDTCGVGTVDQTLCHVHSSPLQRAIWSIWLRLARGQAFCETLGTFPLVAGKYAPLSQEVHPDKAPCHALAHSPLPGAATYRGLGYGNPSTSRSPVQTCAICPLAGRQQRMRGCAKAQMPDQD
jgi:hypothetical protein